ncbi:hypothetical protein L6164_013575 [Bauhinia variegata]|uniref:Uncharacterized protein n=1 Tax=Bauhinia variegata TaxID=167791 RepID=A0ACB9NFC9_BAUVA|nr:hypothetical protein L6164_013575 [Bauhinia variegata]
MVAKKMSTCQRVERCRCIASPAQKGKMIWHTNCSEKCPIEDTSSSGGKELSIKEATVLDLQLAFKSNKLTSRQLVEFYLKEIERLNPILQGVIEVNPDALAQADRADQERQATASNSLSKLHGIPILLKDNIATEDKLNTTAGSFALLGSVVPRDAGVVRRLRESGAIILGKASLSEWANFRSNNAPSGWNARVGQGKNPYTLGDPSGSSSGSAISAAANLAAVTLGTETDGSILSPSGSNSVVGIKPTVGLTSRAGVVPISLRQDSVGPICRTVSDAAFVLEAIVGIDARDKATIEASQYIPKGGYAQFLKINGLRGKRLGIFADATPFFLSNDTFKRETFVKHLKTLREKGAVLVDNLELDVKYDTGLSEDIALAAEFKLALNAYLEDLVVSKVRSLADVIAFNKKNPKLERLDLGQELFLQAEETNGIGEKEKAALQTLETLSTGFEKIMKENKLDAVVLPTNTFAHVLAIGGYPGVIVPAGYGLNGPFGILFGGLKGYEPKLIEIAYSFEQATKIRKPPPL